MPSKPTPRLGILSLEDRTVPAVIDLASGTLSFTAAVGEANTLSASTSGGRFRFEQTGGAPLTLSARATSAGWTTDGTGKVSGPVAAVTGVDIKLGDRDDTVTFEGFEASILRLIVEGGGGNDAFYVGQTYLPGGETEPLLPNPQQTGVAAAGEVTFRNFDSGSVYKYITAGGAVSFTNAGTDTGMNLLINRSINGSSISVMGGSADDFVGVNYKGPTGAEIVLTRSLSVDGGAGENTLTVSGNTVASHTFTANATQVTRDGAAPINYTRMQKAVMVGGSAADAFAITPCLATGFILNGMEGADTLTVQSGPSVVGLNATQTGATLAGTASTARMMDVGFAGMESVAPQPAIAIAVRNTGNGAAAGSMATFTIAVANTSTATLANVAIADLLPAAFRNATWTAVATNGSTLSRTSGTGAVSTVANLAGNGSVTLTVRANVAPDSNGLTFLYKASATAAATATTGATTLAGQVDVTVRRSTRPTTMPTELYAVAAGVGSQPMVKVYNRAGGAPRFSFLAYDAAFRGGVNVATGDVTGDGVEDIITAPRGGGGPHVKVFDGVTGQMVKQFLAYDSRFTGGVNVATGYVVGDAQADILTAPASAGAPHVRVFDGATGTVGMEFMAYDPAFRGGVSVAAGNLSVNNGGLATIQIVPGVVLPQYSDADGVDDVITAPSTGGGPHVKVFDGVTGTVAREFMAYDTAFRGGVMLAAGDVDGDGRADIVTAPNTGGGPFIRVFSGAYDQLAAKWSDTVRGYMAFDATGRAGYRVALADINLDGKADILTSTGPGVSGRVVAHDGGTLAERFVFGPFDPAAQGGLSIG